MDLTRFLATEYDPREHLQQPMQLFGGLAASNGHVLIILHEHELKSTAKPAPPKLAQKAREYIDTPRTAEPIAVASIDLGEPTPCPACDGTGSMFVQPCGGCKGQGAVQDASNALVRCKSCEGVGDELCKTPTAEDAKPVTCPSCEGFKADYETRLVSGALFQRKYLALLATLPDCQLQVAGSHDPARFTFTGGYGVLMPCRTPDAEGAHTLH